jgi:hypothetical protein
MKKLIFLFSILLMNIISFCQTIDIPTVIAGSTGTGALGGNVATANQFYFLGEYIYTDAEIGASNFTSASTSINAIAFNAGSIGSNTNFGNVKVYLQNVPSGTTTFTASMDTATGYTQVFGGASGASVTVNTTGWAEIPISSFVRTPGTNLQILIYRADGIAHQSFLWNFNNGNSANVNANNFRRYTGITPFVSGSSSMPVARVRAQIRLKHYTPNDAYVNNVFSLGKLPTPNATPHIVSANISNNGTSVLTSLPVTLTVTGANSFTNVQTIASLAPGASTVVYFSGYTATIVGIDNIAVTVPMDDDNTNNLKTTVQTVNVNTWSYSQGSIAFGGIGFPTSAGDLVAKFSNSVAGAKVSQVTVNFVGSGQPYKIGFWNATGAGSTPSLIYETTMLTSSTGINVIPISPAVSIPTGDYYVGVRQTGSTNIQFGYQIENVLRPNTFFALNAPSTTWVDFSPLNNYRFMIEPKLELPIDASVSSITIPSGNTCVNASETVTATLSNVGSLPIAAGAAAVTLKITGANPQIISTANVASIAAGASEIINFAGINFSNAGLNNDTVYVNLAGDVEQANDTTKITNTRIARNVALETSASTYPLTANCTEMGWTYYQDASAKNVLAIEWGSNAASKAAALATITLDAADYTATAVSGASATGTFTMKRYWNVNVGAAQPTTAVNVRFFYDAAEKAATDAAALAYKTANAGSFLEPSTWFKTSAGSFVADVAHVTNIGVVGATSLTDVNTSAATIGGVLYAQFDGITSFSGGTYASGVGPSAVLPTVIDYFKASKQGNAHFLNWKINCITVPSVTIILERSADGINFKPIQTLNETAARCGQSFDYIDAAPLVGINYYRLKTITQDGYSKVSTIVALLNTDKGFELVSLSPNPVANITTLSLASAKADKVVLKIINFTGKIVSKQTVNVIAGNNTIDIDFASYSAGVYMIAVKNNEGEEKVIRFMKY